MKNGEELKTNAVKQFFLKITNILTSFLGLVLCMGFFIAPLTKAKAEETTGEKLENKVDEAKTDVKKEHRKIKRNVRKAKGTDNVLKDAKDGMDDTADNVSDSAKKLKRKAD